MAKSLIAILLLSAAGACLAQDLPDPTRPPAAAMPAAPGAPAVAAAAAGPVLQSILLSHSPSGRRVAVISGETLRVGDRFGDATVAKIGVNEVVLKSGGKHQTLKLYPDSPARQP